MDRTLAMNTLERVCHRYGPGRLPNADNQTVGAGYAAAAAAVVATILFAAVAVVVELGSYGATGRERVLVGIALAALPVVVPAAFVAGVAVWTLFTPTTAWLGALAGVAGTVATYHVAVAVLSAYVGVATALSLLEASATEVLGLSVMLTAFGFLFTFWLAFPVGCLGGALYQRVVGRRSDLERGSR